MLSVPAVNVVILKFPDVVVELVKPDPIVSVLALGYFNITMPSRPTALAPAA